MKKPTIIIISISVVLVIALIAVLGCFFIPYSAEEYVTNLEKEYVMRD